jgi:hypothetical protein
MNRHIRDRQFLTFTRGLLDNMPVMATAIDAVAAATLCENMPPDGVCPLDKKNTCHCRDAVERVIKIVDAERGAQFQP